MLSKGKLESIIEVMILSNGKDMFRGTLGGT
jgi:hypothetical protein